MKNLPIRLKLTLWYTSITCLTFLVVALAIYFTIRISTQRNTDRELALRLEGIRIFLQKADSYSTTEQLSHELQERGGVRLNGDPFQVVNQEGHWIYRPASVLSLNLPAEYPQPGSDGHHLSTLESQGKKFRILSGTVRTSGQSYGVQIVSNVTSIYNILSRILWVSLAGIPFILLVAGAGGYWLSKRAMLPVLHITQTAKSIGERNLAERVTVSPAHDELRELTETLNDMLQRLETAFKRITRFTADASHELRTPIAIIRTTAEFILQKERSIPEYQQFVGQILVESEATTEMIEGLLTLARADSQPNSDNFAETDLWMLSAEVVQSVKLLADTKGLVLEILPIDKPAPVWARHSDLRKLIVILLDNAIKYTPERGRIEVRVSHFDGQSFLEVKDTGTGIAEEDIPHIFERFYRADKGRSRETGGIGLGLSIAQAIADDHAAHIVVRSRTNGGSSFRILFPARDPTLGTALPTDAQAAAQPKIEQWNNVPPASVDYGAARDSLKAHIKKLVEQLAKR
jgi:heavy metal sensor kinase